MRTSVEENDLERTQSSFSLPHRSYEYSYKTHDSLYNSHTNDLKFKGGIVGYMNEYPASTGFEDGGQPTRFSHHQDQFSSGGQNSTLTLMPFRPDQYRHDAHVNSYRCLNIYRN